jgi:Ca2+-binding EF-hand superfamily protein
MVWTVVTACLLLGLVAGNAFAVNTQDQERKTDKMFTAMDTDDDGKISWAEFALKYPDLTRADFDKFDKNKDGFLDKKEWAKAWNSLPTDLKRQEQRKAGNPGYKKGQ